MNQCDAKELSAYDSTKIRSTTPCFWAIFDFKNKGMISGETFAEIALSFPYTETVQHFERKGFKVIGKRMFTTYLDTNNTANIFLTPAEQAVFCEIDSKNIYPVPNKWGEKGATTFELSKVSKGVLLEALLSAYNEVRKTKTK